MLSGAEAECTDQEQCRNEYIQVSRSFLRTNCCLAEVPRDIPGDTVGVWLTGNAITSLPAGVFSHVSDCMYLYLEQNQISSVDQDAFSGIESLSSLYLGFNRISHIEPGTFPQYLQALTLDHNILSEIMSELFGGLTNLLLLSIFNNPISHIETGAFDDLHSLKTFTLPNARLTTLNPDLFLNLPHPFSLYLGDDHHAKWNCTSLCWLKHEHQQRTIRMPPGPLPTCADGKNWVALECLAPGECAAAKGFHKLRASILFSQKCSIFWNLSLANMLPYPHQYKITDLNYFLFPEE